MAATTRSGVFSTGYRQALMLRRGLPAHAGTAGVVVLALWLPLVAPARWQPVAVFAVIAAVAAVGLHLLTGLAGQVSLGHAAFLSTGAYTATWLGVDQEMPAWVWIPAAGLTAAALGATIGPVATRLRGLYLAVVTLALVFVTGWAWRAWETVTGGDTGKPMARLTVNGTDLHSGVTVAGLELNGDQAYWYVSLGLLAIGAVAARNLQRTRIGRAFTSIRDRDLAASAAGVPVTRIKTTAFVVSSFYAGVAGALLAAYQEYALPEQWDLLLSIEYLAMIIIGGMGSVAGAIAGAVFVTILPELVRMTTGTLTFISERSNPAGGISVDFAAQLLYGLVIVLVLVAEPRGLVGLWRRFMTIWRTWPWSY